MKIKSHAVPGELITRAINRAFDSVNDSKIGPIFYLQDKGKTIPVSKVADAIERCAESDAKLCFNQLAIDVFLELIENVVPQNMTVEYDDEEERD